MSNNEMDINAFVNNLVIKAKKVLKKSHENAVRELLPVIKRDVQDTYKGAVMEWYGHYVPEYYHRTYSLYDILAIEDVDAGGNLGWVFQSNVIERDVVRPRNNGQKMKTWSLYDKVFIEGWHGGAESGIGMRYRTPYPYFTRWGRRAYKTTSVLDVFNKRIPDLEDEYQAKIIDLTYRYFDENKAQIYM